MIDNALKGDGEAFGLTFKAGNCKYLGATATFQLEVSIEGTSGEAEDFKRFCHLYLLVPTDIGRTFTMHGDTFKLIGIKPRKKNAIICENIATGRRYAFHDEMVRLYLNKLVTEVKI
jgi:hypothetical protein